MRAGAVRTRAHDLAGGQFAVELGDLLLRRDIRQFASEIDRLLPFLLDLVDLQQVALRLVLERGPDQLVEDVLGAVKQAGLEEILPEFRERMQAHAFVEIGPVDQILVHADRPLGLAAPAEQVAQREVQFDRLRIDLGHLQEGIDGLVRLLVEQEVESLEIGARQGARFVHHLPDIDASRRPAQPEEQRNEQQLPVLEKLAHAGGGGSGMAGYCGFAASRLRREISRRWR